MGQLVFQATLGGQVSLVGPNTASTISINIPATNGNMVTTGDTGTVTNTMLANSAITFGSTSQALGSTISAINGVSIGASTAGTGAFTTLSASSTVSGTGFSTYLASPPAIGGTTPAAITGTNVIATAGLYGKAAFSGSYSDGIVVDYTTGLGRISVGTSDGLAFYNAGVATTELMRLDSSGNLGIGVSPSAWSGFTGLDIGSGGLGFYSAGMQQNAYYNGTNWIYKTTNSAAQYLQSGGQHRWWIAPSGTAGNAITFTQAMTLDASGRLLVGTTTPYDVNSIATFSNSNHGMSAVTTTTSGGWYAIECGRTSSTGKFIGFTYPGPGTEVGSVSYNGTLTLYNQTSDQRLKENIVDAGTALETIEQIKIRSFDWIESKVHETHGVIAQELKEIAPQCVTEGITNEDGSMGSPWQVDTSPLVPMLIKAIQELNAKVTALETQLGAK